LRRKRDLLLSINGVGETLAAVVLAELPGPNVLRSSAEVVAYRHWIAWVHVSWPAPLADHSGPRMWPGESRFEIAIIGAPAEQAVGGG
jgi:hypothetical protein